MKPRVFTILLAITLSFTVLTSYASADTDSTAREKVQRLFESDEEKIAQDAIWVGDVFSCYMHVNRIEAATSIGFSSTSG